MDLNDLNVLKQDPNGGSAFTEFNTNRSSLAASTSLNNLQQSPPPLPSRANANSSLLNANSSLGSYGGYGNYGGYGGYGGSSLFNSYGNTTGSYFNNYSNYGMSPFQGSVAGLNNSSNGFLRAAEENSRTAFQSIESVVHAFSAVSAMFESTYYAVYNSFRAVVGVADQFYRLKTHLSGILSALAIIRALKYLLRKCLRLLRLSANGTENDAWSMASNGLNESEIFIKENGRHQTNWPLLIFLAVVLGGPYLIWKALSSIESLNKDDTLWMNGKIDHFIAASEHDFDAVNSDELSFRRGQRIIIAPKEYQPKLRGWLLATIDGKTQGIVPANYIKILGKKTGEVNTKKQQNEQEKMYATSFDTNNSEMPKLF